MQQQRQTDVNGIPTIHIHTYYYVALMIIGRIELEFRALDSLLCAMNGSCMIVFSVGFDSLVRRPQAQQRMSMK